MRAFAASSAGSAAQYSAVLLALGVDWAERWCGECGEHARMRGNAVRDSLPAGQPGPDELVGIGAVDLRAWRAAGGTAGLARDGQDSAGFVDGGVAVQQFASGTVDVIDAAAQQDWLQAAARMPGGTCRYGVGGQRWCSSRRALAGRWTSGGRPVTRLMSRGFDQRCCAARGLGQVACRSGPWMWLWHRDRASGDSPARRFTVIPRYRGSLPPDTTRT
jgi:hypothetical protein